jgi:exonuclease SbcD
LLRIIYLSDTHIMSDTPKNRKDNFLDTVSRKLREVAGLCRDLQVDCVIHGGDVFDQPHPGQASLELMHRFLEELVQYPAQETTLTPLRLPVLTSLRWI